MDRFTRNADGTITDNEIHPRTLAAQKKFASKPGSRKFETVSKTEFSNRDNLNRGATSQQVLNRIAFDEGGDITDGATAGEV